MYLMDTLDEAIKTGYVVRRRPDFAVSNQYWRWCEANAKPFVAITLGKPHSRYAQVEIDLHGLSLDGFPKIACYEILRFLLGVPLKRGTVVSIGPIFTSATVSLDMVRSVADFLYRSAIDEGVCIKREEYIETLLKQAKTGEFPGRRSAPAFSFDVYKVVLEDVATKEFWESITKEL